MPFSANYVVRPYREPPQNGWKSTGRWSVGQAAAMLTVTGTDSNNNYLFSESGCGPQPIVLVGSPAQVSDWLKANNMMRIVKTAEIQNIYPNIYVSVSKYKPSAHQALNPGEAVAERFLDAIKGQLINCLPLAFGPKIEGMLKINDALGAISDFKEYSKKSVAQFKVETSEVPPVPSDTIYVRIHYIPDMPGSIKVGEDYTKFSMVYFHLVENRLLPA